MITNDYRCELEFPKLLPFHPFGPHATSPEVKQSTTG